MIKFVYENASLENIPDLTAKVEEALEATDCPMKAVMQIDVAIDEIYSNIVNYGYKDEKGTVEVRFEAEPSFIRITFVDSARPYNPLVAADPDTTLSAEDRKIGGLGVFIVKKTMDEVNYSYKNGQNVFTMKKNI